MKEKIMSLVALGVFALAIDSALPDFNNWFAFGANAVELTERINQVTDLPIFVYTIIEFIF
ncbi:hypothetical protein JQC92_07045 [Shewanella sp. 202IG2-18]|uniref:hypothetical protein n=1 Tax=Parashewanella hymeniacidonis TaxID=2807618 RepID=UPI001961291F|nr:hypothetical protein [Parashewanella hymeniacidonis]MBM7071800.1 hypothetical protein [Parashewanella hymeniacidonis]